MSWEGPGGFPGRCPTKHLVWDTTPPHCGVGPCPQVRVPQGVSRGSQGALAPTPSPDPTAAAGGQPGNAACPRGCDRF